jgi:hypothetical protein
MRARELFEPLIRPACAALLCIPVLAVPMARVEHWRLSPLAAVIIAFCGLYAVLSWFIILTPQERKSILARRLGLGSRPVPGTELSPSEPAGVEV